MHNLVVFLVSGEHERGLPPMRLHLKDAGLPTQKLHKLSMADRHCKHERGLTRNILYAHICAGVEQHPGPLLMAILDGQHERCVAMEIPLIRMETRIEELLHRIFAEDVSGGIEERRLPQVIPDAAIRARTDEHTDQTGRGAF